MENTLADRMKLLRTKRGSTQKELSYFLKMDRSNVANYENGKRVPTIDTVIKIANFYGVSVNYLLLGEESQEATPYMQQINSLLHSLLEKDKKIQELANTLSLLKQGVYAQVS
ncbi:MAG: helix-turn-helix domain-containing protein [Cytophagaceae bacterium]|nr:helix-turn-helix domain-containing protein [Cytophagaceae bacterium]